MCKVVTPRFSVAAVLAALMVGTSAASAEAAPPAGAPTGDLPAPLRSERPLVRLPVPGFGDAVVSLPLGATRARPVLLAVHGNYDRPEWQCETWREIVGDRAFVLCPRGKARSDSPSREDIRFTYAGLKPLEREIAAALGSLRARYGAHVDGGPLLYAGFSLGAILGSRMVTARPSVLGEVQRLVLTEGGQGGWTQAAIRAFAGPRGAAERRVLLACGLPWCTAGARKLARRFEAEGVRTRVVEGRGEGHSYAGKVATAIAGALGWWLQGDPRFDRPLPAAPTP